MRRRISRPAASFYGAVGGALLAIATVVSAAAQTSIYTPPRGSAERTEILDALRATVGETFGYGRPGLVVETLNVADGAFAYVVAQPLTPDGSPIDYASTAFAAAAASGRHADIVFAFLTHDGDAWSITETAFGALETPGLDWVRVHSAPSSLVGVAPGG